MSTPASKKPAQTVSPIPPGSKVTAVALAFALAFAVALAVAVAFAFLSVIPKGDLLFTLALYFAVTQTRFSSDSRYLLDVRLCQARYPELRLSANQVNIRQLRVFELLLAAGDPGKPPNAFFGNDQQKTRHVIAEFL
jgi:hypothetical protein